MKGSVPMICYQHLLKYEANPPFLYVIKIMVLINYLGVATIVQGIIVQGHSCPRRLLSKVIFVQGTLVW